ncbi:hypothetical protein BN7_2451 [Wickerhamomyces ciferrii]|uniref:Uncharacterized protein n=1 Tax=Wickerhamomyces ciferrii (strain ATCC 14091 / BCRC 22168 / CBS 111 / JCM 3599 / NBRC 0793 / NRRL Y-1031 F-60-10) TaxID=1206466 RepID=K0KCT5_WICCF|nr:uncharacterized protein BN7_2451 [Wickerhamomyces ciferrii]CCH42905.1 hypothetical protein BN7_2451 [Wickerhamomyces ciferrii]
MSTLINNREELEKILKDSTLRISGMNAPTIYINVIDTDYDNSIEQNEYFEEIALESTQNKRRKKFYRALKDDIQDVEEIFDEIIYKSEDQQPYNHFEEVKMDPNLKGKMTILPFIVEVYDKKIYGCALTTSEKQVERMFTTRSGKTPTSGKCY